MDKTIYLGAHIEVPKRSSLISRYNLAVKKYRDEGDASGLHAFRGKLNPATKRKFVTDPKKLDKIPKPEKWPEYALVLDCETSIEELMSLTFGGWRVMRQKDGAYTDCRQEGFFYAGNTVPPALAEFAKRNRAETSPGCSKEIQILSLRSFVRQVFYKNTLIEDNAGALVVGVNLSFDLSRLVADYGDPKTLRLEAKSLNSDWSLVLERDKNPKTGKWRANPFYPRIKITRRDGQLSFISFTRRAVKKNGKSLPYVKGRFLDLGQLGWALRNVHYGLDSMLTEVFHQEGKMDHAPTGRIDIGEIEYNRDDVRKTAIALNGWRKELGLHPIDTPPDEMYSSASLAKGYFEAMGLIPPPEKFKISPYIQGIACQAYAGGRSEVRIRRKVMPCVYLDYRSNYPSAIILLGLWKLLCAKELKIKNSTKEVRRMFAHMKPDDVLRKKFLKKLVGFAMIQPKGHLMPVRSDYGDDGNNLAVNYLKAKKPIWIALPDLVAMKLLYGEIPRIIRAIKVLPVGVQEGLRPVSLRGSVTIDPRKHDFFKVSIEHRERVANDKSLSKQERKDLKDSLKIPPNSAYGFQIERNPRRHRKPKTVTIYSGEEHRRIPTQIVEEPGKWYFPIFSSLTTSGGRLLLAILEREVVKRGGTYLATDTDAMDVVASKKGGIIPCPTGERDDGVLLPDDEILALSWKEVKDIISKIQKLSPYDDGSPLLKAELDSLKEQLYGFAVSAKRLALFNLKSGVPVIRKASMHGLGHFILKGPKGEIDEDIEAKVWIGEAWKLLLGGYKDTGENPDWLNYPAMVKVRVSTPRIPLWKAFRKRQKHLPYSARVKPFNFVQSPEIHYLPPDVSDPAKFRLVKAVPKDSIALYGPGWINMYTGKEYSLHRFSIGRAREVWSLTLADIIEKHLDHPEAKSLAPDGSPCAPDTEGLLKRMLVVEIGREYVGKETDRALVDEEDAANLSPESNRTQTYNLHEKNGLVRDRELQKWCRAAISVRKLEKESDVGHFAIQSFRKTGKASKRIVWLLKAARQEIESEPEKSKRDALAVPDPVTAHESKQHVMIALLREFKARFPRDIPKVFLEL